MYIMAEIPEDLTDYLAQKEALWAQRKAKLKTGPNVIFLGYLSQHISPDELLDLESDVNQLGFELGALDKCGVPFNSISSVSADLLLSLAQQVTLVSLVAGSVNSGVYDGLKALVVKCWRLVKDKRTVSMSATTVTERQVKFHLKLKLDEHRTIELKTENLDEQNIVKAIDSIGDLVKSVGDEKHSLLLYDPIQNSWQPIEVNFDYLKQPEKVIRVLPLEEYLEEMKKKRSL